MSGLRPVSEPQAERINAILNRMSASEAAGQVLAWRFPAATGEDLDVAGRMVEKVPLGCLSVGMGSVEQVERMRDEVQRRQV